MLVNAEGHGVVEYVDADEIVINYELSDEEEPSLKVCAKRTSFKFKKTNHIRVLNLCPSKKGDKQKPTSTV
jgi:DNA-directed RNA polymerase subunit beta